MTVGAKMQDLRHDESVPGITGGGRVGYYLQKTWSGGDSLLPYGPKNLTTQIMSADREVIRRGIRIVLPGRPYWARKPERPKAARLEDHPYTASGSSQNITGLLVVRDGGMAWNCQDLGNSVPLPATLWTSNDDLALLGKLREAIAGSDFNLGVFLGEGKKTVEMIAQTATRLYNFRRYAVRGNFRKARDALVEGIKSAEGNYGSHGRRKVASGHLELQYGWLPLLSDLEGGAHFLAHNFSLPPEQKVVVVRNAGGVPRHSVVKQFNSGLAAWFYTERCSKRLVAKIREKSVIQLSGLLDPLSVAWELVPFSFVFDWAIPVGNYLQARALPQALQASYVSSYKREAKYTTPHGSPSARGDHPLYTGAGSTQEVYSFVREVFTAIDVPLPSVKPLGKILSFKHALNAVALLH